MQTKYLLALNAHPQIGSQTIKKVLAAFDDKLEKLWRTKTLELQNKLGEKIANLIIEAREQFDPDLQIKKLNALNIGYMTMYDKEYPALLKQAVDSPAVLYIRGNLNALNLPAIGVVGSRKFSHYGQKVAYNLAKECSESGLCIVSGLALGIDAVAHKAALDTDGITIGVLGCGLDRIYPASNLSLGRQIIEKDGAIVSEFPPGTPPLKFNFPARNRIIAGLSLGTLVIEAAEQSGALITAYQALEYNREVFAVPGNIDSPSSVGTNLLIKKGAKVVTEVNDILEELNIEAKKKQSYAQKIIPETDNEKAIVDVLSRGEKLIDDIIKEAKINIVAVNTALTMMEMKGIVESIGGGRYKLR